MIFTFATRLCIFVAENPREVVGTASHLSLLAIANNSPGEVLNNVVIISWLLTIRCVIPLRKKLIRNAFAGVKSVAAALQHLAWFVLAGDLLPLFKCKLLNTCLLYHTDFLAALTASSSELGNRFLLVGVLSDDDARVFKNETIVVSQIELDILPLELLRLLRRSKWR